MGQCSDPDTVNDIPKASLGLFFTRAVVSNSTLPQNHLEALQK